MKKFCLLVSVGLSLSGVAGTPKFAPKGDTDAILNDIKTRGAKVVVASMYADQKKWNQMLSQVELGETKWLLVASQLYPGSDAASAEEISYAVSQALLKNPTEVLSRIAVFRLENICQVPFIEPSPKQLAAFRKKAKEKLSRIKGEVAQKCLENIDK